MKRLLIAVAFLAACAGAQPAPSPATPPQPPPLLDRELFFGDPEITGAQISPDGRYIAAIKPPHGTRNIRMTETGKDLSTARALTHDQTRPTPAFCWTRARKPSRF